MNFSLIRSSFAGRDSKRKNRSSKSGTLLYRSFGSFILIFGPSSELCYIEPLLGRSQEEAFSTFIQFWKMNRVPTPTSIQINILPKQRCKSEMAYSCFLEQSGNYELIAGAKLNKIVKKSVTRLGNSSLRHFDEKSCNAPASIKPISLSEMLNHDEKPQVLPRMPPMLPNSCFQYVHA